MIRKHVNLNSLLAAVLGVMLTFALRKLDDSNTRLISVGVTQKVMVDRLDRLERDMVLRAEFRREIDRLEELIRKRR